MELEYILENLTGIDKLRNDIVSRKKTLAYDTYRRQYDPKEHGVVKDTLKRPDKKINIGTDEKPEYDTVYVSRLPVPFQKKIVRMRATFLCGNPIELSASPNNDAETNFLDVMRKTWDDNKLDYKSKQLAKLMMSETECAELWYPEEAPEGYWDNTPNQGKKARMRVKILALSKGDELYPVFDSYGDMVAFCRAYITEGDKKVHHFDIYTDSKTYYTTSKTGMFTLDRAEDNVIGKIPIIYYSQDQPEWADVQALIEQYEDSISDHTDNNKYNGSPTTVVKGDIEGWSKKGEQGKVLQAGRDADVSILAWDQATDSLELEQKNLRGHIMDDTSTPDISFEKMKGVGNFSGIALKLLFLDAHMAASDKEEIFGEAIQRRINYLKAAHTWINTGMKSASTISIKPKFEYFLPKNDLEKIQMLIEATSGEKTLMPHEEAVKQNPLNEDGQAAWDAVEKEKAEADKAQEQFNNSPGGLNRAMNIRAV